MGDGRRGGLSEEGLGMEAVMRRWEAEQREGGAMAGVCWGGGLLEEEEEEEIDIVGGEKSDGLMRGRTWRRRWP